MTRLAIGAPRAQAPVRARPFRRIPAADGSTWALFHRNDAGYLLRFPDLADFAVSCDLDRVECAPAPGATDEACRNTYLNVILPAILGRRGKLVVHASCVEIDGAAVLFLGDSGRGKSTLATSFARSGHGFLSDDGVVLESADGRFQAQPREAAVRLWPDSVQALLESEPHPDPACSSKTRVPAGGEIAYCDRPATVRAAYFLGDGRAGAPVIEPMTAAQAFLGWAGQTFVLDTEDRPALACHFERIADLSNRLACHRLDYPRRYEALEGVRRAIAEHHRGAA